MLGSQNVLKAASVLTSFYIRPSQMAARGALESGLGRVLIKEKYRPNDTYLSNDPLILEKSYTPFQQPTSKGPPV